MTNTQNTKEALSRNLSLRPIKIDDANTLLGWYNDRENVRLMSTLIRSRTHSLASVRQEILTLDPNYERVFIVELNDLPVGLAGIDDIEEVDQRAEIFFLLGEASARGCGLGTKMAQALIRHAFDEMKLNSLIATAAIENTSCLAVLRKCGFAEIGRVPEYNYIDGRFVDEVFLSLTRSRYLSANHPV